MASVASKRSQAVSPASSPAAEIDYASHGYSYPSVPVLYEMALDRREVRLAATGPMVVETGVHTGRSAKDKFVVDDSATHDSVWWGAVNQPMTPDHFATLEADVRAHLANLDTVTIDLRAGADPRFSMPVRLVTKSGLGSAFRPQSVPAAIR